MRLTVSRVLQETFLTQLDTTTTNNKHTQFEGQMTQIIIIQMLPVSWIKRVIMAIDSLNFAEVWDNVIFFRFFQILEVCWNGMASDDHY